MRQFLIIVIILSIAASVFGSKISETGIYTVERVIDGDTLKLTNGEIVQLIGIESPDLVFPSGVDRALYDPSTEAVEQAQRWGVDLTTLSTMGQEAKENLTLMLGEVEVLVELDMQKRDKYGRILGYVFVSGLMKKNEETKELLDKGVIILKDSTHYMFLNAFIIGAGYAQPMTIPPNVKYAELFQKLYEEAKEQKRGLWKVPNEKYLDQFYCEEDADCIIVDGCCGGRPPVNIYYDKDKLLAPCATRLCTGAPIYENPRCVESKCVGDLLSSKDIKKQIEVSDEDKICEIDSDCIIIADLSCTSQDCHCNAVAYNKIHSDKYSKKLEECRKDQIIARCDNLCRTSFITECIENHCQIK